LEKKERRAIKLVQPEQSFTTKKYPREDVLRFRGFRKKKKTRQGPVEKEKKEGKASQMLRR